jgi:hypothetical protein
MHAFIAFRVVELISHLLEDLRGKISGHHDE